jgi:hypothetical protein
MEFGHFSHDNDTIYPTLDDGQTDFLGESL